MVVHTVNLVLDKLSYCSCGKHNPVVLYIYIYIYNY